MEEAYLVLLLLIALLIVLNTSTRLSRLLPCFNGVDLSTMNLFRASLAFLCNAKRDKLPDEVRKSM